MANICWTIWFISPSYPFLLWFSLPLIWNSHNANWMRHISRIRYINYLLNCWCVRTNPSSRMGNFTSQLPTMFWILKSRNFAGKPSFCTTRAYFLAANLDCSSLDRWRRWQENKKIEDRQHKTRSILKRTIENKGKDDIHCRDNTLKVLLFMSFSIWWISKWAIFWPLGSSADHLSRAEDKSSGSGFSYSHDDGSETLQEM